MNLRPVDDCDWTTPEAVIACVLGAGEARDRMAALPEPRPAPDGIWERYFRPDKS